MSSDMRQQIMTIAKIDDDIETVRDSLREAIEVTKNNPEGAGIGVHQQIHDQLVTALTNLEQLDSHLDTASEAHTEVNKNIIRSAQMDYGTVDALTSAMDKLADSQESGAGLSVIRAELENAQSSFEERHRALQAVMDSLNTA